MFGPWTCPISEAFYLTPLTIAIVNLKPILPGHCLVLPRRVIPRFTDLTAAEVSDLWQTVQKLATPLQYHFGADALTLAIQDGAHAGQTVSHVHVHVIPRKHGDFNRNDEIYDKLEETDLRRGIDASDEREERSEEQMANEALELRALFKDSLPFDE